MQRASGDSGYSSYRPQNDDWHRRSNGYSTRRLSTAIDSLRREGEAILWELNSLMTQNLSLEQRLIGQTEELSRLNASIISLQDQHRNMEQQYRDDLQALRSELNAAQRGLQSSGSGHSNNRHHSQTHHERHHSPPSPLSLEHTDRRRSRQYSRPSTPSVPHNFRHRESSSRIPSYSNSVDHKESELLPRVDSRGSPPPYSTSRHRSFTPPSLRAVSSLDPSPDTRRLTSIQARQANDVPTPPKTNEYQAPVSPSTTLIGSDGSDPRSRHKPSRG